MVFLSVAASRLYSFDYCTLQCSRHIYDILEKIKEKGNHNVIMIPFYIYTIINYAYIFFGLPLLCDSIIVVCWDLWSPDIVLPLIFLVDYGRLIIRVLA